jgi:glucosamine kinase
MILICDSGSTKADFALLQDDGSFIEFGTEGLNPVHLSEEDLHQKISSEKNISAHRKSISTIYFFGSGCGNEEGKSRMERVLIKIFPGAQLSVDSHLMAAALATAGDDKGIISILGTGSNCCYYDGLKIHLKNFGLGYILGDESSGAWFGKKFLQAFLYDRLPLELYDDFYKEYKLNREKIIEAVYRKPNANLFLSSLMPYIIGQKEDSFIKNLLAEGLNEFFETGIAAFPESKNVPLHFIGSVAASLEAEIHTVAKEKNLSIGKILKRPMDGLQEYFLHR